MSNVSNENRVIAKSVATAFGGEPKVVSYWDDKKESCVDVLICKNRPQNGVTSYSTIGLSDSPLVKDGDDFSVRLELVGACENACDEFPSILSTAAFCIINSKWFCSPGSIFPDVISMYKCSATMHHLMFVPPFLWEGDLNTMTLDTKSVAWLLAVPISEAELQYSEAEGVDKLEELFEEKQIDIYNINRPSVV